MDKQANQNMVNVGFTLNECIKKIGYKSLRGFIKMIKAQNKSLNKMGCKATFTITLPIKD